MPFFPLNVRTEYSIENSALRIRDYVARLKQLGYEGGAVADYDHLFAYGLFAESMKGMRALFGVTKKLVYREDEYDLGLFVLNEDGYRELLSIMENKSSLDPSNLNRYRGLAAVLSTAAESFKNDPAELNSLFLSLSSAFETFYLGIEIYSEDDREKAERIRSFAADHSYKTLAYPRIAYLHRSGQGLLNLLKAIKTDQKVKSAVADGPFFLLGPKAVEALYTTAEIDETSKLAARSSFNFLVRRGSVLKFTTSKKESDDLLAETVFKGLERLGLLQMPGYSSRALEELKIIADMGYSDYFLIVQDYVEHARAVGIRVGPGRGSAAGSLVSFALGITAVDPLRFGLSFERFLNPLRTSMPDIDIDFEDERRDEVIAYLKQRYGEKKAASIITINTLQLKSSLRHAGQALGYPAERIDSLAKMIGNHSKSLEEELALNPQLRRETTDPYYAELIRATSKLIGFPLGTSIHAAGVILSADPIDLSLELYDGAVGLEAPYLERLGFLKMDILGLRNLTLIKRIESRLSTSPVDVLTCLEDPASYETLCSLDLVGIFQLESRGIRRAVKEVKPSSFNDLVALLALYRPGPMDNIPLFARRKNGNISESTGYPALDEELKETYGVIVYQEQIIRIAQKIAGFSAGKADLLRRAISKKDRQKIEALKDEFIAGATAKGYKLSDASAIYDLIERFADYGFNKSHTVAYALITLTLLWYKTHVPIAFYGALLEEISVRDPRFAEIDEETNKRGIRIVRPDIDISTDEIVAKEAKLYLPLKAIVGLTPTVRKALLTARAEAGGSFSRLSDFLMRLGQTRTLDVGAMRLLISAGALDRFGYSRTGLLREAERLLDESDNLLGDEELIVSKEADPLKELIREKDALGRVLTPELREKVRPHDGFTVLVVLSPVVRSRSFYRFEATDGAVDYFVEVNEKPAIDVYDLIRVKGIFDWRRRLINCTQLEKEN